MYGLVRFGARSAGLGFSSCLVRDLVRGSVFGFGSGFASVYACDKVSGVPWCIIQKCKK